MLANTPKLQLPQWESTDPMDYTQVNAALLRVENKLTPSSYTTALRPTGTERYDGLVILDTDLGKYLKWNAAAAAWRSVDFNGPDYTSSISPAMFAGFTLSNFELFHKNGVAQIYMTFTTVNALGAGNITNVSVCTVPAPWWPRIASPLPSGVAGNICSYYISQAGIIAIGATSEAVPAGTGLSVGGTYLLT